MQPHAFLSLALLAVAAAVVGYVAVTELFTPGRILTPYFNWLSRAVGPEAPLKGRPRRDWLFKPLGGCLACFTGQLALWAYVASVPRFAAQIGTLTVGLPNVQLGHAIFTVSMAIFVATQTEYYLKRQA